MVAHRVRYGKIQKDCLHNGDWKYLIKGRKLSVVSYVSLYQEAEGSSMEG